MTFLVGFVLVSVVRKVRNIFVVLFKLSMVNALISLFLGSNDFYCLTGNIAHW